MLDEQFKRSIVYGMPYDLFWFGDPQDYFVYADAYNEKQKEKDVLNWQLGQYITSAIGVWLGKNGKYPDKPIFYAQEKQKPKDVYDMRDIFISMVADEIKNFN